jgi:Fe-S cluster assembly protein SufD
MDIDKINSELIELITENRNTIDEFSSTIINKFRNEALNEFKKTGIPTKANENYKYTDLTSVFNKNYNVTFKPIAIEIKTDNLFKCDVVNLDAHVTTLSRGRYIENEKIKKLENGIIVASFHEAAIKYPEIFEKHYAKYGKIENNSLYALNTVVAQDGIFIYFPKNALQNKPIQIINLLLDKEGFFYSTRNLIVIEENAQANIIFCDDSLSVGEFIGNTATEIYVGKNAELNFYKIQNEHNESCNISSTFIYQDKDSRFNSGVYSLLGGLIRNNFDVNLNAEGCESNLNGLSLIDKNQHIANFVYMKHTKPHCNSNQLFKTIIDDNGSGAFNGQVYVCKDAQQTNANQTNKNILLSNMAKINTKPHLVIYADDVKCTHGATVGQLNEEAMFYMQARGIPKKEAKMLLMYAFANEVIESVKIESLRQKIEDLAQRRLNGDLSLCRNCSARVINQ